jgi:YVTN family beta-propeller protein
MMKHYASSRILIAVCLLAVCGIIAPAPAPAADAWLGPVAVAASKDGKRLFVANADAKQIALVDAAAGKVTGSIAMPAKPTGMVLSPDGKKLYVTCAAPKSTVEVLDAASGKKVASIPTGHTAVGPAIAPDGKMLYVCNRFNNAVVVIDLATGKETARIATIREPISAAVTPDGKTLFVANHLPGDRADTYDIAAAVTVIDTAGKKTTSIRLPNGSSSLRGICVSPDGKYAYVVHILGRYQMPTTQVERGWINTNAMSVIDVAGKKLVNTVLLDDVELGAANPWGVSCTADGASICVTHAGTHEVSVIDAKGLIKKLLAIPGAAGDPKAAKDDKTPARVDSKPTSTTTDEVPNDLAFLIDVRKRISLQGGGSIEPIKTIRFNGPRGLAVVGSKVYAAGYFSDNLAVVDLKPKFDKVVWTIDLGPEPKLTVQRRGEIFFHDASLCFQKWQSCSTCHPDARVDALNWDLGNDGFGNPKNARTMLLAHKTPPAMSLGIRAKAETAVRSGIKYILFTVRPEEEKAASAIDEYLKALKPVPSPYLLDGKLSESAERGKKLFFDKDVGCAKCHPTPLYTDLTLHDVTSKGKYDRKSKFDTPALIECWRTAPYMHDGQYTTIKELLTKGKHGSVDTKLKEKQIADLVEFVLSL